MRWRPDYTVCVGTAHVAATDSGTRMRVGPVRSPPPPAASLLFRDARYPHQTSPIQLPLPTILNKLKDRYALTGNYPKSPRDTCTQSCQSSTTRSRRRTNESPIARALRPLIKSNDPEVGPIDKIFLRFHRPRVHVQNPFDGPAA